MPETSGRHAKAVCRLTQNEEQQFNHEDRVWLSTCNIKALLGCSKLNSRYIGPYKIQSKVNPITSKLDIKCYSLIILTSRVS